MFGLHFSRLGSVNILAPINRALSFISALSNSITPQRGSAATFTRSTTATYVDDSGVIQTAAINTPRFQGGKFLSEPARTNLMIYSEDLTNAAWGAAGGLVVTPNTTISPDGSSTADTATATSAQYLDYSATFTNGVAYTFSIYLKSGSLTSAMLLLYGTAFNSGGANVTGDFNLAAGTVALGNCTGGIVSVGNGWYRCWITATLTATTGLYAWQSLRLNSAGTVYAWGAQLEAGNRVSSYIPTVAATVTRAADSLTYPVTASTAQGGLCFTIVPAESPSTAATYPNISYLSVSNSNHIGIRTDPGNNNLLLFVYAGGSFSFDSVIASITAGSTYKVAVTWSVTDGTLAYSVNGGAVTLLTGKTLPSGLNTFKTSDVTWNGQLSDVKVFTQTLSDNTLRQLTT